MRVHVHVVKLGTFRDAQITPLWSRHVLMAAMVPSLLSWHPTFDSPLLTLYTPLYTHVLITMGTETRETVRGQATSSELPCMFVLASLTKMSC